MKNAGAEALDALARELEPYGPPIIVFNKSHSGSRLLARMLREGGVAMGHLLNESEDAYDILRIIRPLVERYYPRYDLLFRDGDAVLVDLIREVFELHLQKTVRGERWGWKLCETLYILPVLARLFPRGWFVHLVRDGRDVTFCNHVAPDEPFWKKVYFNTEDISIWRGLPLTEPVYRENPHLFNAQHWVNSVTTARSYGTVIGERYTEIKYEDLASRFLPTARQLVDFLALPLPENFLAGFSESVLTASMGKYQRESRAKLGEAMSILEPTLTSFGYVGEITGESGMRPASRKWFWPF